MRVIEESSNLAIMAMEEDQYKVIEYSTGLVARFTRTSAGFVMVTEGQLEFTGSDPSECVTQYHIFMARKDKADE